MLNADSSTLKSESDAQRSALRRRCRAPSRCRWISSTVSTMLVDGAARERALELRDEEARLVRPSGEAEQRERQEEERDEREQREVGDHRREMRAAVGEELRERIAPPGMAEYGRLRVGGREVLASPLMRRRTGARRPDRDLVPDRGRRRLRPRRHGRSPRRWRTTRAATARRRGPRAAARGRRSPPRRGDGLRAARRRDCATAACSSSADGDHVIAATTRPSRPSASSSTTSSAACDGLGDEPEAGAGEAEARAGQADDDRPDDEEDGDAKS